MNEWIAVGGAAQSVAVLLGAQAVQDAAAGRAQRLLTRQSITASITSLMTSPATSARMKSLTAESP